MKPSPSKKQLAGNEDAFNWDEVNKIRKATKGCLTILKERINSQFEKKPEFNMSFGLGPSEDSAVVTPANKLQILKEETNKSTDLFMKKREETLMQIKRSEINIRKSKTPLRLGNPKTQLEDDRNSKRAMNQSMVQIDND